MSRLSDFRAHVQSLEEIQSIINAMKNLAIIEINRVAARLANQRRVVETIEAVGRDFYTFHQRSMRRAFLMDSASVHPEGESARNAAPGLSPERQVYILIGSERGFCGGFNEQLVSAVIDRHPPVIAIGRKLHARLEDYDNVLERLDGPDSLEEIDYTVHDVVRALGRHPGREWFLVFHEDNGAGGRGEPQIVHPFEMLMKQEPVDYPFPPYLTVKPRAFSMDLLDQYVIALLYQAFFSSFMAENRRRLHHMDGAVARIDRSLQKLHLQLNVLRQEEIIEEIEVLLLNVAPRHDLSDDQVPPQ